MKLKRYLYRLNCALPCLLLLTALGTGSRSNAQDLQAETVFYQCAQNAYAAAGTDLDSLMLAYESDLLDRGECILAVSRMPK